MIAYPLNDEDCLYQVTVHAIAAMDRADVRELAARLETLDAADDYLRRLPQREDGPDDESPCAPHVQCDVPQRVRVMVSDPNCVERSLLRLALGELIDPRLVRQLMTIDLAPGVRHTLPIEDGEPIWLEPAKAPRNALRAGVHLVRNARGEQGAPLAPLQALDWAVRLVGDDASTSPTSRNRHDRAMTDVARIADGLLPLEPAALSWALKLAVPEAMLFGPEGRSALMSAAGLLDSLFGGGKRSTK